MQECKCCFLFTLPLGVQSIENLRAKAFPNKNPNPRSRMFIGIYMHSRDVMNPRQPSERGAVAEQMTASCKTPEAENHGITEVK
jgi:hypothetical protein